MFESSGERKSAQRTAQPSQRVRFHRACFQLTHEKTPEKPPKNNITAQIAPHVMRLASFLNLLFRFIRDISNKKTLYGCVVYNLSLRTIKQYIHPSCYKIDDNISYKIQKRHALQYKTCSDEYHFYAPLRMAMHSAPFCTVQSMTIGKEKTF